MRKFKFKVEPADDSIIRPLLKNLDQHIHMSFIKTSGFLIPPFGPPGDIKWCHLTLDDIRWHIMTETDNLFKHFRCAPPPGLIKFGNNWGHLLSKNLGHYPIEKSEVVFQLKEQNTWNDEFGEYSCTKSNSWEALKCCKCNDP